ncbi:MAG: quinone-dependent dihydroorotate dehydrogenase [Alphaproteobacteria bacterium]|nr:quinone-dependent dihydroorotate dehydrogenase [Alphaproteobacteria bacterium]
MSFYRILRPLLFTLPPETAHQLTLNGLRLLGAMGRPKSDAVILRQTVLGRDFDNPFGMAAGFDKNGDAISGVHRIGFGFAEIGTLTPLPQPGNPMPRVFRLTAERALINRLGFNNRGQMDALARLENWREKSPQARPVGVNIGANKEAADRIADYDIGAQRFAALADYLTVNISSPNTPGLRDLQSGEAAGEIMRRVRAAAPDIPVLVKIAPDMSHDDAIGLAELARVENIDGLIISNTTLARDGVASSRHKDEAGGVSGTPVFDMATDMLRAVYRATGGKLTLIGVGGVSSAAAAYAKIRAGASLVQLYTGLVYEGPGLVTRMKSELAQMLRADGFSNIADAIGADARRADKGENVT